MSGNKSRGVSRRNVLRSTAAAGTIMTVGTAANAVSAEEHCTTTVTAKDSIQDAIDEASQGDTICVEAGVYEENVDIRGGPKAELTLTSEDPDEPATIAPENGVGVFVTARDATVTHLNVVAPSHGITVGGSGVTVEHNDIDAGNRGVNVGNSTGGTINHNVIRSDGSGVRIAPGGTGNALNHNEVQGVEGDLGIDVNGDANTVHHNEVAGLVWTRSGSEDNSIKHNTFDRCRDEGTDNDWFRNDPDDCDRTAGGR